MSVQTPVQISVFGAGTCDEATAELAFDVGRGLARAGAVLVCGGRGGVMAAACRGARSAGGTTVGILPGTPRSDSSNDEPNPYLDVVIHTGMGQARNLAVALSGRAALAVAGGWGTLSEIALARKHGVPVVSLHSWTPDRLGEASADPLDTGLHVARDAEEAVALALDLAGKPARKVTGKPVPPP